MNPLCVCGFNEREAREENGDLEAGSTVKNKKSRLASGQGLGWGLGGIMIHSFLHSIHSVLFTIPALTHLLDVEPQAGRQAGRQQMCVYVNGVWLQSSSSSKRMRRRMRSSMAGSVHVYSHTHTHTHREPQTL